MNALLAIVAGATTGAMSVESLWTSPDVTPCGAECKEKLPEPPAGRAWVERHLSLASTAITGMLYEEAGRMNQACGAKQHPEHCLKATLPYDSQARQRGDDWPAVAHTMVGSHRLRNFREAVESVIAHQIPGDIAELGVWRGGASIFARTVVEAYGEGAKRRSLIFDAFETIPSYGFASNYLAVSEQQGMPSLIASFTSLEHP